MSFLSLNLSEVLLSLPCLWQAPTLRNKLDTERLLCNCRKGANTVSASASPHSSVSTRLSCTAHVFCANAPTLTASHVISHPTSDPVSPAAELENLKSRNPDLRIEVAAHISYGEFVQLLRSTKIFISPLGCDTASPSAQHSEEFISLSCISCPVTRAPCSCGSLKASSLLRSTQLGMHAVL